MSDVDGATKIEQPDNDGLRHVIGRCCHRRVRCHWRGLDRIPQCAFGRDSKAERAAIADLIAAAWSWATAESRLGLRCAESQGIPFNLLQFGAFESDSATGSEPSEKLGGIFVGRVRLPYAERTR